jgi:hypothetical protein
MQDIVQSSISGGSQRFEQPQSLFDGESERLISLSPLDLVD